jgi:PAS domain S-box-containing protein
VTQPPPSQLDPALASAQLRAALERAEGALRESQRQYREIFELASVGVFRSTPDGRILLANPALAAMLGYQSPDELRELDLGRDIYLRADDRAALVARYQHTAEPWTIEVEWRKRDGTPLWVQISAHAVPDDSGRALYFEAFVQDVTERRLSTDALRLSEARYRALVTNLPDTSVFLYDHDLRYVLVDGATVERVGLSKEALVGHTIFDFLPADIAARLAPLRRAALAGEVVEFEDSYGGRTHAVHLLPIRDGTGAVIYGMGVAVDVTGRKRAEQALRESQERLQLVARATNDAVWDWDLVTGATWWAEGFQKMFGYAPEEIEPGPEAWSNRLHPDERERVVTGVRAAIDGGESFWSDEYRFRRRDGGYAEIYDRGYVIRDAKGHPIRMVGSMMEVSERKRAEAQLRNLAARLEAIREEERTRIAREIHDEFGQALTALKMDLAWLGKKVPPRGVPVREKLHGMEAVIDDTMDALHRILAELRPGVLDDLGLPAAIRWLAEEFKRRHEIACTVQMSGGEPRLESGQATAVFRILQEALTNVARHAQARRVEIRLHVLPTAFELVVTDDGRGITAQDVTASGTLGILGMRERAITWHGRVTVRGEPGAGTTVRVFMPMDRVAAAARTG